ncbi:MAG: CHAT domain-containing protein [Saprospiraceae bacterium]
MLKLLLSVVLFFLMLTKVNGQEFADSINALRYLQLARAALAKEQPDSLTFYVSQAQESFQQAQNWDSYNNNFVDFAKTLFTKWSTDVKYVEVGIQSLKTLYEDLQQTPAAQHPQQKEIIYQIARGYYFQGLSWQRFFTKESNEIYAAFDSCKLYVNKNLAKFAKMPPKTVALERANHYNLLGVAYTARGDDAHALEELEKALAIRITELGTEDDRVASVYFNIGNAYTNLHLYNKALDAYTKGIKIRKTLLGADNPRLANMYFNVGVLYEYKEEYDNAITFYNQAKELYEKQPQSFDNVKQLIAEVSTCLAVCYQNKGAYQESSIYHQQSIQEYEQAVENNAVKIADYYTNQAMLADLQRDYKTAVELHEKAVQLYQQKLAANDARLIQARNNLGNAYAANRQFDRAIATLQGALQLIEKDSKQQELYASLISDLGLIYFTQGDFIKARENNLKALKILQKIFSKSYKIAVIYNNLAKIAAAEKNHTAALDFVQQALITNHLNFASRDLRQMPASTGYFRYDYFVESLMLKARLLRLTPKASALLTARALYQVTDSVLTQVQNELIASEDKIRLSEKMYALSESAIENCLQLTATTGDRRYWEEAFYYTEKSKNTVLTQSITANHAKHFAGIPDSLIVLEDRLQSDIRYFKLQLLDSAANTAFQNELFEAQRDYRVLMQRLEQDYPLYYQLKYDRSVPKVSALQASLPAATALLSYFIGDSILYSFVITQQDFQVYRTPLLKDFADLQVGLRKTIQYQLDEYYVNIASNLYQLLFPFKLDHHIKALIIIPDGNLSKLPFETLLTAKPDSLSSLDFSQLPYLLNRYEISYALSGTSYYQMKASGRRFPETGEGLLAYAPVFDQPQSISVFSNGTRNPFTGANNLNFGRTITSDGQYVSALPATANEVQSIANIFKEKGQPADIYLFQNANENQLKHSDITHSKYLHIATHGFINEAQPDLSGLLLFPDSTEQEDHILYSGEVYNIKLNANLVVLSACETGLGKVASGEGLLGLSRAFFYAGAENLLVSLWKVQDQATADLMVSFYQQHLTGKNSYFRTALHQAKLNMIRSEQFNHPYYWSAFVLIGQ